MDFGAEISMYPLTEHFEEIILKLIRALKQKAGEILHTNDMITQIAGGANAVFSAILELSM